MYLYINFLIIIFSFSLGWLLGKKSKQPKKFLKIKSCPICANKRIIFSQDGFKKYLNCSQCHFCVQTFKWFGFKRLIYKWNKLSRIRYHDNIHIGKIF